MQGIYQFVDTSTGKLLPYVGQSGNIAIRLQQLGSRIAENTQIIFKPVSGGKTAREVAEQFRINELTGGRNAGRAPEIANKVNPIGDARKGLLKDPRYAHLK